MDGGVYPTNLRASADDILYAQPHTHIHTHTHSVDGGVYPTNLRASADDILYAPAGMRGGAYDAEPLFWTSRPAKPGSTGLVTTYSDGQCGICMYVCVYIRKKNKSV